jgi:hypothetical protein
VEDRRKIVLVLIYSSVALCILFFIFLATLFFMPDNAGIFDDLQDFIRKYLSDNPEKVY